LISTLLLFISGTIFIAAVEEIQGSEDTLCDIGFYLLENLRLQSRLARWILAFMPAFTVLRSFDVIHCKIERMHGR
jgi:hypothetical protein